MNATTLRIQAELKALGQSDDAPNGWVEGVANKFEVDRYGELVYPAAFANALPAFMVNPVFALQHETYGKGGLPIGKVLKAWVDAEGFYLRAAFDADEQSQLVRSKYVSGSMRAFSVCFLSKADRVPTAEELSKFGPTLRRVITELELIEISAAVVPVNAGSLASAVKALETKPEEMTATKALLKSLLANLEKLSMNFKALSDEQKTHVKNAVEAYNVTSTSMSKIAGAIEKLRGMDGAEVTSDPSEAAKELASGMEELSGSIETMGGHVTALKESLGIKADGKPGEPQDEVVDVGDEPNPNPDEPIPNDSEDVTDEQAKALVDGLIERLSNTKE